MAHYHFTVKAVSRRGGKSTVAKLAYRSATDLKDQRTGETHNYSSRGDVFHVDMLLPDDASQWIIDLAAELRTNRQSSLQKFSDIIEATEKRINSRVYREVEFALPNELTNEQNIKWSKEFVKDYFCKKGMVAIVNYHGEVDEQTGIYKPHCHVLLSTRNLAENGFGLKNRDWDSSDLVDEWRDQCSYYQNAALKENGFDVRVTHLSYEDRELDIDAQTKLGKNVREMTARGIATDKQKIFDMVRLKNQFKIVKDPEVVFKIVTSMHSTFTRRDVAKVLNRYIDDAQQFRVLLDRLMASKELVNLEASGVHKDMNEPVYTTQEMLRVEMNIVNQAAKLSTQHTHTVHPKIVEKVIAKYHDQFKKSGGLSADQEAAIRHMLEGKQVSCVVGFAGAGKTTCLKAARETWEEAGYRVLGLAPTGKAARNIENCGIRSMTIHKFLFSQQKGRERISDKTIIVADEFGMVDSRRCSVLLSLMDKTGAKIVPMGDGNQAQAVEAGPAFRLLNDNVKPVILEKVVRQQVEWQRGATQLFGSLQAKCAIQAYLDHGCITTIQEKLPDFTKEESLLDGFCLSRQMSGRIYKEMKEDLRKEFGLEASGKADFSTLSKHHDFKLYQEWKEMREAMVVSIINCFDRLQEELRERGVNIKVLGSLVEKYKDSTTPDNGLFKQIESILRKMSYGHIADTRASTREALVKAWIKDYQSSPEQSHLMLAFTNRDANQLNESARNYMREQGKIVGKDYAFITQRIETDDFGVETKTYHDRTFAKGDRILFTRNNNNLDVKNGSLGTILKIDKNKMTVALDTDDDEQKTVSFSPRLYPFLDNGWATTIIKAQGVTVDHVKLLASFEQYRNLAYVGMSRHRLSLQMFASILDFWREEKIIDRLSRVQEKLSGFDYLDTEKIQHKLKEDTDILWHHQKIQQGKDFWSAIKVTARDVFDKAFGRFQGEKEEEEFHSFDESEEIRSRDFFTDATRTQSRRAYIGGEGAVDVEKTSVSSNHPFRDKLEKMHNKETVHNNSSTPTQQQDNQHNNVQVSSFSQDELKQRITAVKEKIKNDYGSKIVIKEKPLSFKEIEDQLRERMFDLATALIDKPITLNTSRELRFGKDREIRIALSGKYQGFYHNFETGVKGGPLKLIEDQQGLSSRDALKWAAEWLGGSSIIIERHATVKQKVAGKDKELEWTPIIPVPKDHENPDIIGNQYLSLMLKGGRKEGARYAYRDEEGNLKGYVVRLEKPDGDKVDKITPPLSFCKNEKGQQAWRWIGFEKENKTPYKVEVLSQCPHKPVLIVEGEKTADAAQKLLPEYNVLTWSGGAGSVGNTNWQCLFGKTVVIWPDYDYDHTSQKAADKLYKILNQLNKASGKEGRIGIVDLHKCLSDPHVIPDKWDLADKLPEGWDIQKVRAVLNEALAAEAQKEPDISIQEDIRKEITHDHQAQNRPALVYTSITIKSKLDVQREAFETSRLPVHQEWCATLGFMEQYRRFPENLKEISAAYWQGECLTAIEGRLYKEVLEQGGQFNEEKLTLQARKEWFKYQKMPGHILTYAKALKLIEEQIKVFEQHVVIHRARTNQFPGLSEMENICQAINAHNQIVKRDRMDHTAAHQSPKGVHNHDLSQNLCKEHPHRNNVYRNLIEQQAILAQIKNGKEYNPVPLKMNETQASCAEKLNRMNEKIRDMGKLSQEMENRNQQNQRGMDL